MIKIFAWLGTVAGLLGAFLVAGGFFGFGYIAFLASSLSWLYVANRANDKALLALNAGYFAANIFGLINLGV